MQLKSHSCSALEKLHLGLIWVNSRGCKLLHQVTAIYRFQKNYIRRILSWLNSEFQTAWLTENFPADFRRPKIQRVIQLSAPAYTLFTLASLSAIESGRQIIFIDETLISVVRICPYVRLSDEIFVGDTWGRQIDVNCCGFFCDLVQTYRRRSTFFLRRPTKVFVYPTRVSPILLLTNRLV